MNIDAEKIMQIDNEAGDFNKKMKKLVSFESIQDIELIRAIDYQRTTVLKNARIETLKDTQFDPQQFALANNSTLRKLDHDLLA